MRKESRFWKKGIKVLLAVGLLGTMLVPTSAMANEYVTPSNGKADDSLKSQGTFIFYTLDENGSPIEMQTIKKDAKIGSTFKEAGIEFPTATYENLNFLGWIDRGGNTVDENTTIYDSYNVLYPKFDKVVTKVSFKYLDNSNEIKEVTEPYILEHGATYQDLVNQCADYRVQDISKEDAFSGWVIDQDYHKSNATINASGDTVHLKADFENKKVLELSYEYYNTQGFIHFGRELRLVDKNLTFEDFAEKLNKSPLPELFKGLRASGWWKPYAYGRRGIVIDTTVRIDTGVIKSYDTIYFGLDYENFLVRFMVDDMFRERDANLRGAAAGIIGSEVDTLYAIVAEKGETITVPDIKEYTNIKWVSTLPEGDNLTIDHFTDFYGYGDKVDAPIVNPDDGNNDNNGTDVPDVTLPEDEINNAVNEVKNANKGETVTVDMKDNVTLPVEVLESARGKDVEVVFNMGAYSWSINGLDITADTLKAINLEVKLNANAISADVVKTLAGDRPTMQLSLSHNGEFGFKAKLQVNLGAEHKGKYGNLYYYNKDGKLEFMNAGKIDENGNVALEFTHASDYVVVIDEKNMAEVKNTENPIQDTSSNTNGSAVAVMVLLTLLGGAYYLHDKKVKKI